MEYEFIKDVYVNSIMNLLHLSEFHANNVFRYYFVIDGLNDLDEILREEERILTNDE